jgi:hypothetical protein
MRYEVHGYYGNPDKRRNGLRWTANDIFDTLEEALVLAGEWLETERYEFTEITDKATGRRVGELMGMGGK